MNPLDIDELIESDKVMRADMPYHRQNELKVKFTYGNLPKNAFGYAEKVNNKFLNDNLGIIEEMEYRDNDNYIPKWFKAYQNGIYRDTEILNHDNFFKEKSGDSIENIDEYHFKHDGRIYPKVSGAQPMIMNPSRFGVAYTTGILGTFGSTAASTTGLQGQAWSYYLTGLIAGNPITSVGVNIATAAGSLRLGIYDDAGLLADPVNLLGESASTTAISGWNDIAVSATVPANGTVWLAVQGNSGSLSVYYDNTVNVWNDSLTYGAFADPYVTAGSGNLNRWNMRCTN